MDDGRNSSPRRRRRWLGLLRIAVCAAALWLVLRGVTLHDHVILRNGDDLKGVVDDRGESVSIRLGSVERVVPRDLVAVDDRGAARIVYGLRTAWGQSAKRLLALAVLCHFPVTLLMALRLRLLLHAQAITLAYWDCVKVSFAGNFLNFATPLGSHAGDVFKAYFVTTHTEHKTEAATTIFLDRALGLAIVIAWVAVITTFSGSGSRLVSMRTYVLGALLIGVSAVATYVSPFVRRRLESARWGHRLPMVDQIRRIDATARTLLGRPGALGGAVAVTVALQFLAISAYFMVAVAIGMNAHAGNVLEYLAYFYTGAVIQALPGPPQGLGTVELAYRYFFAPYGSPSQIVCMAFLIRIVVLVCALPGLLVTLTGTYRPRPSRETETSRPGAAFGGSSNRSTLATR